MAVDNQPIVDWESVIREAQKNTWNSPLAPFYPSTILVLAIFFPECTEMLDINIQHK